MSDHLDSDADDGQPRLSRRGFIQSALAAATVGGGGALANPATPPATPPALQPAPAAPPQSVRLTIDGNEHELRIEPRTTLLDAMREHLGITGPKKGCDRGQCGACTVLVDGRRINACLSLAVMHEGDRITTIAGLAQGGELSPLQQAFLTHDAFQCGYCTPGQVCSATALLDEIRAGTASAVTPDVRQPMAAFTDEEIRERMSGNLCRCGAYPNIVAAIRSVAMKG